MDIMEALEGFLGGYFCKNSKETLERFLGIKGIWDTFVKIQRFLWI